METQKLKLKIGDHEFEAEGPVTIVQAQFEAFRELVQRLPARAEPPTQTNAAPVAAPQAPAGADLDIGRIMSQDGRLVSLTARGASVEDEILLVLLGQKVLRNNDSVTGGEVIDGLRLTGRTVQRVDYYLDKMTTTGDVMTIGVRRARRYRLTNTGSTKAREVARTLIANVA